MVSVPYNMHSLSLVEPDLRNSPALPCLARQCYNGGAIQQSFSEVDKHRTRRLANSLLYPGALFVFATKNRAARSIHARKLRAALFAPTQVIRIARSYRSMRTHLLSKIILAHQICTVHSARSVLLISATN